MGTFFYVIGAIFIFGIGLWVYETYNAPEVPPEKDF